MQTGVHLGLLWLRVFVGFGIAYHGYGKIFGDKMDMFAEGVGAMGFPFPVFFAWLAALSEFAGGFLVVIGLRIRWAALFIFLTMSVAAFIRHASDPFSVKELALAYWTAAGCLIFTGAGRYSIDGRLNRPHGGLSLPD